MREKFMLFETYIYIYVYSFYKENDIYNKNNPC